MTKKKARAEEPTPATAAPAAASPATSFLGVSAADRIADVIHELDGVCASLDGIRVEDVGVEQAHAHAVALEAALGRVRKFAARLKARA